jgi:hypothetical protein
MPIKIKTDLNFGQVIYIKNDPYQSEHILTGVKVLPQNQIKFILSYLGDEVEIYDFECSTDRDDEKYMQNLDKDED